METDVQKNDSKNQGLCIKSKVCIQNAHLRNIINNGNKKRNYR